MSTVQEIEAAIEKLSVAELTELQAWMQTRAQDEEAALLIAVRGEHHLFQAGELGDVARRVEAEHPAGR